MARGQRQLERSGAVHETESVDTANMESCFSYWYCSQCEPKRILLPVWYPRHIKIEIEPDWQIKLTSSSQLMREKMNFGWAT